MLKLGKKARVMNAVCMVLAILPVLYVLTWLPGMPDQVPMKIAESGEVLRYGSRWELLMAPALCLVLTLATAVSARKQASSQKGSDAVREAVYIRYTRNGIVTAVVLNIVSLAMFYMVLTGHGIGF